MEVAGDVAAGLNRRGDVRFSENRRGEHECSGRERKLPEDHPSPSRTRLMAAPPERGK
jgi:hypothetical protein